MDKELNEAQGHDTLVSLQQDNTSAIQLENNGKATSHKTTRHISIKIFIVDQINNATIEQGGVFAQQSINTSISRITYLLSIWTCKHLKLISRMQWHTLESTPILHNQTFNTQGQPILLMQS